MRCLRDGDGFVKRVEERRERRRWDWPAGLQEVGEGSGGGEARKCTTDAGERV